MTPGPGMKSARLFDFSTIHGLHQCVTKPTRIDNILDLIFSNDRTLISDIVISPPFGMSDHNSVCFKFVPGCNTGVISPVSTQVPLWTKANWVAFGDFCQQTDWSEAISNDLSVDQLWSAFCTLLETGIDLFVPLSKFNHGEKPKRKHCTKIIRKLKANKLKFWKKMKQNKTGKNKRKYRAAAKKLKLANIAAQEAKEIKLINSNSLGQFYKHVNQCSVHQTGIGPLNDLSCQMVLDDSEKANLLNSYFVSVETIDNGVLPPLPALVEEADSKLDLITCRTQQITLILRKLKNKMS
jgi:hypothetical protein